MISPTVRYVSKREETWNRG